MIMMSELISRVGWRPFKVSLVAFALSSGLWGKVAHAAPEDAARTLGFESLSDWTVTQGFATLSASETRTQGLGALAVQPGGWSVVESRLVGPFSGLNDQLSIDLQLPTDAHTANPYWSGELQLLISAPSVGFWNRWIQAVDLRGLGGIAPCGFDGRAVAVGLYADENTSVPPVNFNVQLFNLPASVGETRTGIRADLPSDMSKCDGRNSVEAGETNFEDFD